MRRVKFLLIFLAALLVIIVLKSIWIGLIVFAYLVKYLAIAGVIAWIVYLIAKKTKKDE
jgi:Flp pilus assembly protein TadB